MEFEIVDHVQPFITSPDVVKVNTEMAFSALDSNLPDHNIADYYWELGDGTLGIGPEIRHSFNKPGIYDVKLGLKVTTDGSGNEEIRCIMKELTVVPDNQALGMLSSGTESISFREYDWMERDSGNDSEERPGFAMEDEREVFRIEILSSDYKLDLDYPRFEPLQGLYDLREFYLPADSIYSYAIGEYNSLPETYAVYNDLVGIGFTEARVKSYVIAELPTDVIAKINRDFAELRDALFEFNQSGVSANSYPLLKQVADILIEHPELALEVAAHTDNIGSQGYNLELSQKRAQTIVEYLVHKGIDRSRLTGKGYGESRPIATNSTEEGRIQNRRVEFIIIDP
jgi:outer membrane protein OmpA-like peptidoglycan-associated protein